MQLHYLQVDCGEGGIQSMMAANSKSHAVSQTADAGASKKGLKGSTLFLGHQQVATVRYEAQIQHYSLF